MDPHLGIAVLLELRQLFASKNTFNFLSNFMGLSIDENTKRDCIKQEKDCYTWLHEHKIFLQIVFAISHAYTEKNV